MEQGATEKFIIQQCVQQKLPLPARIANAPELMLGSEFYFLAFLELTTCRNSADGVVSWLAIKAWADEYEISGEQREDLFHHVQAMDAAYMKHRADKLQAKARSPDK